MTDIQKGSQQGSRAFAGALAFVGLVCLAYPSADLILNNWPLSPGDITWRYQFVGMLSQMLITPLIGLVFLAAGGILGGQGWLLTLEGWLSLLGSVVLLGLTVAFVLDASELRNVVAEPEQVVFNVSSLRAIVKNVLTAGGMIYVGIGALRAAKRTRRSGSSKRHTAELIGT